ncbi:SDR family oxidoreductase [Thalassolituus sp. LLYu03]|uniref:SDR family oxidoreductase n=1 Tax=Thalassolituus sp. LLYu03 TaxID=3421656 RepID=UPI003D2DE80F
MSKTAFITGAASGIGLATARALYARGWTLAMADINTEALRQLTFDWDHARVTCYPLDVCNQAQFSHALTDFTARHNGQLNLLFNCAGILSIGRFEAISAERHQQIMNINVMGVINGCQAAFPFLKATPGALVVNMSSASATYGIPGLASYSASKFAVSGLTEALQLEWEKYDINVCDVMPPFVSTPMLNEQAESAPVLKRLGVHLNADDVAKAVVRQTESAKTHRTVSLHFGLLYQLGQLSPRSITRAMVRMLNR